MFSINISKSLLLCSSNRCTCQHLTPPAGEEDTPVLRLSLSPLYCAHQCDDAGSLCLLEHFHPRVDDVHTSV